MPASECKLQEDSKAIAMKHCTRKRGTRREAMERCRKRGKDWVWDGYKCQRAAVRDKRDKRELIEACRKRGTDWVWRDGRCQRTYVRDKRNR